MLTGVKMVLCLVMLAQTGELSLSQRLDQLDSADYATRLSATMSLLQSGAVTAAELDNLYKQAKTPEQKHRLEQVAMHQCLRQWIDSQKMGQSVKGSVGILMHGLKPNSHPQYEQGGIWVIATLPGFPAHELLQADDLIVAIDGTQVTPKTEQIDLASVFQTLVQSHLAGSTVEFTIIRKDRTLQIQCPIAPKPALDRLYTSIEGNIQLTPFGTSLWQKRLQTLTRTESPTAEVPSPVTLSDIPIQWQANAAQ